MTKVRDIMDTLEQLAPPPLAESWDNCGLLIGNSSAEVGSVVLTLDITEATRALAETMDAELIITHHPVIFTPLTGINYDNPEQRLLLTLIQQRRSVYSAHTNLDSALGGVNDALMDALEFKADATLIPSDLEFERADLSIVRAVDPCVTWGLGRISTLSEPQLRFAIAARVNNHLRTAGCFLNFDTDAEVKRVAVCGGSFDGGWIDRLVAERVDLLISGEIKHHDLLAMKMRGIGAIAAGHDCTERVILPSLAGTLAEQFSDVKFAVDMGLNYNHIVL
ncbi:MAG: Nif3-like dinuclear metal center hexameric protein [Fastidiosipilaceae bacterium]|jgi:dinuclear metal center YbgI/SA1388 family protein